MLTDLPDDWEDTRPDTFRSELLRFLAGDDRGPVRVDRGLYIAHINFNHEIAHLIQTEHPFEPWWDFRDPKWEDPDARVRALRDALEGDAPRDYGVCDYPAQVVERWPVIDIDPRKFLIYFSPVVRELQPPDGGWRWHKWGTYIGTQEPRNEYIYDDKHIDAVYTYQIVELI